MTNSGVKRDRKQDYPGPKDPYSPGPRVPGSIQHLPRITLGGPLATGSQLPKIQEQEEDGGPLDLLARTLLDPLSPEHRSRTAPHRVRYCQSGTGCGTLAGMYPGSNGMALAGHQGHYYPGTPPPPPTLFTVQCGTVQCGTVHCSMRHCSMRHCALFNAALCTVQCGTVLFNAALYCSVNGVTKCSVNGVTKCSVNEVTKCSVNEVTKCSVNGVTKCSVFSQRSNEVFSVQCSVNGVTKCSVNGVTE